MLMIVLLILFIYFCVVLILKKLFFIDNIFAIKSWAKRKFGFEESKIDKNFGIPEDFDYID